MIFKRKIKKEEQELYLRQRTRERENIYIGRYLSYGLAAPSSLNSVMKMIVCVRMFFSLLFPPNSNEFFSELRQWRVKAMLWQYVMDSLFFLMKDSLRGLRVA